MGRDPAVDRRQRGRFGGPIFSRSLAVAFVLGKFLELNGLVILGLGLVWGMYRDDLKGELQMLGIGVLVFLAGYVLEHRTGRRS